MDFVEIFDPQGVQSVLVTFHKNHFPTTFGGHREFLRETLKTLISETVRDRAISTKFMAHRVYEKSTGDLI